MTSSAPAPVPGAHSPEDDWQGLGDLVSLATERFVAPIEGMHRAIADRWLGMVDPRWAPVRAYRGITGSVYAGVRAAGSGIGAGLAFGAAAGGDRVRPAPLWSSARGSRVQAMLNALWGDELALRQSPFGIEFGIRDEMGGPIALTPADLSRAFPRATPRLAVLVHGLAETERCWSGNSDAAEQGDGLADVLAADSFTPVRIRYNTGLHISQNGDALSSLLDRLEELWPVPLEQIALVGHSMGGLVACAAVEAGHASGHRWTRRTRHVVTVGSPHLGAPLEKGVDLVARGLRLVGESRPIGDFLDARSAGIKDLRSGGTGRNDEGGLDPRSRESLRPGHVEHHFIGGVVTADPSHPLGAIVGDLMVRLPSSTGRGRRRRVAATSIRVLGGRRHFDLVRDDVVHDQIRVWLADRR